MPNIDDPPEAPPPLLSILIPSYNRGARVEALVSFLIPVVESYAGQIELIVVNNRSTDDTAALLERFASPSLVVHHRDIHLPTAEENMFNSLHFCRGTYVWFHGDDDLPHKGTLAFAMTLLATGEHDFLSFNSRFIDKDGGWTGGWFLGMEADLIRMPFTEGTCAAGPTTTMAAITNAIQRRSLLERADWRGILARAPIYSHVAWWLIAFRDSMITFVNRPLVDYRIDDPVVTDAHFARVAAKANVPNYHFWTTGLVDLFSYLEDAGALSVDNIFRMFDVRQDGSRYRLLDHMIAMVHAQAVLSVQSGDTRNRLSAEALERFSRWLLRIDPGYFECLVVIKETLGLHAGAADDVSTESLAERCRSRASLFHRTLAHRSSAANAMLGFAGRFMGYDLFEHFGSTVAFDDNRTIDRFSALRGLDIRPSDDGTIVGSTMGDVRAEIIAARRKQATRRPRSTIDPLQVELSRVVEALRANEASTTEARRLASITWSRRMY